MSTQPVILLSDLSQEVSVVTDCVRIAPLRVITLNSPLKDSSLWIEYKKTPHPPHSWKFMIAVVVTGTLAATL